MIRFTLDRYRYASNTALLGTDTLQTKNKMLLLGRQIQLVTMGDFRVFNLFNDMVLIRS